MTSRISARSRPRGIRSRPSNACGPTTRPVNVTPVGPILDAVDNCDGGYAFSRVFDADGAGAIPPLWLGLSQEPSRGPFDPQRPSSTFLPDGYLTADDAPMPAARIDLTIAPNKHDGKDIDGVGSFGKTDKSNLYSADRSPNANAGSGHDYSHNLYAPFYSAYVPATGAPDAEASGTDGLPGNNFPGYLVGDGQWRRGRPCGQRPPVRLLGHRARVHLSHPERVRDGVPAA